MKTYKISRFCFKLNNKDVPDVDVSLLNMCLSNCTVLLQLEYYQVLGKFWLNYRGFKSSFSPELLPSAKLFKTVEDTLEIEPIKTFDRSK